MQYQFIIISIKMSYLIISIYRNESYLLLTLQNEIQKIMA